MRDARPGKKATVAVSSVLCRLQLCRVSVDSVKSVSQTEDFVRRVWRWLKSEGGGGKKRTGHRAGSCVGVCVCVGICFVCLFHVTSHHAAGWFYRGANGEQTLLVSYKYVFV